MERLHKGNSLVDFFDSYTIIDIETTGLDPANDCIIEIAALKCVDDCIVSKFSALINPGFQISSFISSLTGITNDMLENAPAAKTVLDDFLNFIGDDILIAHNAHFDINFIYDSALNHCDFYVSNDFVDTCRISRIVHKSEPHHRLSDLCNFYSVSNQGSHRALSDCLALLECYKSLKNEVLSNHYSISDLIPPRKNRNHLHARDITPSAFSPDEGNIFFDKLCVFTGTLKKFSRRDAMQIVVNIGGHVSDSVTRKTNFLILADDDYSKVSGNISSKQRKAEDLKLKGFDIEIISESVFYDAVLE